MNWLITGGCGFIGTNLVGLLSKSPSNSIRILDNLSVGSREDLLKVVAFDEIQPNEISEGLEAPGPAKVELICGDILDLDLCQKLSKNIDVVVHLAARAGVGPSVADPKGDCKINVMGTLNMLEAAKLGNVDRFVYASSGAPLGECAPPIHEELAPHPKSPYGASKLAGEGYCSAYFGSYGLETVVLRFSNVYGPRSHHKDSVVAKFIKQAMQGEELNIYGDGRQTRDFIFVGDLVLAIQRAATQEGVGGEIFQIATNIETSILQLLEYMKLCLRETTGKSVLVKEVDTRNGDVPRNFADISKAERLLAWSPKISLEQGLRKTVSWFQKESSESD